MNPALTAALVLIPLAIFDWIVVAILWRGYRQRPSPTLGDRVRIAAAIAAGASVYVGLVLNGVFLLGLDPTVRGLFIVLAAALPSLGNLAWLVDFLRDHFT